MRAGNHVPIPRACWHFTVLAIMKITRYPSGAQNMREFTRRVFEPIRSDKDLIEKLRKGFQPFTANVYEVRCSDKGLTLQFDSKECTKDPPNEPLKDFRNCARGILGEPVSAIVGHHTNSEAGRRFAEKWGAPLVESILDDPNKNYGSEAFGSIARSPCRSEIDVERWRKKIKQIKLKFNHIHLLVSDEMLTNPRVSDVEDVLI